MPGSRSITDFFKPWTRPKKRPSDCIDEGDRAAPSAASGTASTPRSTVAQG
ncbi:MAG: hypothetical protein INR71_02610 [Terriglobus roseus]|nr:hypothetical protein [Terriglobus roseus]